MLRAAGRRNRRRLALLTVDYITRAVSGLGQHRLKRLGHTVIDRIGSAPRMASCIGSAGVVASTGVVWRISSTNSDTTRHAAEDAEGEARGAIES